MIFNKLRKSRWQHRNPDIRRQALQELTADEKGRAVLGEMACNDQNAVVRRAAVSRLEDLELLARRRDEDTDAGVRELADKRLLQLLCGTEPGVAFDVRAAFLAAATDEALLEQMARQAREPELRKSAINRLQRQSLLSDAAEQDPDPEVRYAAAERISQRSTLERLLYQAKDLQDERVRQRLKARLDALVEEQEGPSHAQSQAQRQAADICRALEALARMSDPQQAEAQYHRLQDQWQGVASAVPEALQERYRQARDAFAERLTASQERDRAAQTEGDLRAQKVQTIEAMERLETQLKGNAAGKLEAHQAHWHSLAPLADATQEAQLQARFQKADADVQHRLSDSPAQSEILDRLQALCREAEALAHGQVQRHQIKDLRRRWQGLAPIQADDQEVERLRQRFEQALATAETHGRDQSQQRQTLETTLKEQLDSLETSLDQGVLDHALPMQRQAQQTLDALHNMNVKAGSLTRRLRQARARLQELNDWRRWANTPHKEALCAEVEALIDSGLPAPELVRQVKEARERWKRLGPAEPDTEKVLWARFNRACQQAYEPARAYFAEQARQREANRAQREALCERLEAFLAEADWRHMDWPSAEALEREARHQWRDIGVTDRKAMKQLQPRFNANLKALRERLADYWARNRQAKEALIEQVEALTEATDPKQAAETAKQLQAQWKQVGSNGRAGQERKLWQRFKKAADAVFERRRQANAEARQAQASQLETKTALVERLEALPAWRDPQQAEAEFRRLQDQWRQAPATGQRREAELERRYREAVSRFQRQAQDWALSHEREQLSALADMAAVVVEAEAVALGGTGRDPAALHAAWKALPASHSDWTEPLARRLQQALTAAQGDTAAQAELQSQAATNRDHKERLCVRMEILAAVDSPPEAEAQRLQVQVERLAEGMGQRASADSRQAALDLEREWHLTGPTPLALADDLEPRFQRASKAFWAASSAQYAEPSETAG